MVVTLSEIDYTPSRLNVRDFSVLLSFLISMCGSLLVGLVESSFEGWGCCIDALGTLVLIHTFGLSRGGGTVQPRVC